MQSIVQIKTKFTVNSQTVQSILIYINVYTYNYSCENCCLWNSFDFQTLIIILPLAKSRLLNNLQVFKWFYLGNVQ